MKLSCLIRKILGCCEEKRLEIDEIIASNRRLSDKHERYSKAIASMGDDDWFRSECLARYGKDGNISDVTPDRSGP